MSVEANESLVRITSAGTISIPKQFRRYMDVQKGDYVKLVFVDEQIIIQKIKIL